CEHAHERELACSGGGVVICTISTLIAPCVPYAACIASDRRAISPVSLHLAKHQRDSNLPLSVRYRSVVRVTYAHENRPLPLSPSCDWPRVGVSCASARPTT